ncbi:MAG TPA: lipopolysaccharide biosynthesis protein [Phycisphaerae bacterium]|nr:lipopolysaccharide biosynthesis protein [Phycisphaerae bacterium]
MRLADRIIINVISNYGLTALGIVANLVMVPVVINGLGRSGFGLATMILAALGVFDLLANTVGRALERQLPPLLADDDREQFGRTFNTGLLAFAAIGALGALVILAIKDWLTGDAHKELGFEGDATLTCWLLAAYMVVGYPWVCYQKTLGAMQRYDLIGLFSGSTTLVRIVIVMGLFWAGYGSISLFAGSLFAALWLTNILCRGSLRRLRPGISESFSQVDRATVRRVGKFAAATLFVVIGNALVTQGFTILVGKQLGMGALGGLAAVLTIRTLLWTLIYNVAGVLTPAVSNLEALGHDQNIAKLFLSGAKYSAMMAVMICGVPLMIAAPFLELWLGAEFKGLDWLLYMLLVVQIPLSPALTSQQVLLGLGRVRITGLVVFARGALAILLAAGYLQWIGQSLEGSAACVFGMQFIGGMTLFFIASSVLKIGWFRAVKEVLGRPLAIGVVGGIVTWLMSNRLGTESWWPLIAATAAGELVFLVLALTIGFNREERAKLHSFAGRAKNRLMPTLESTVRAAERES